MLSDVKKTLLLLAAAGMLAVGSNLLRPDPLPWLGRPEVRTLAQVSDLERLKPQPWAWVDARDAGAFAAGHVAGAVHLPARRKFQHVGRIFELLAPQGPIVVYGEGARETAGFLVDNGYAAEQIYIFAAGWEGLRTLAAVPKAKGEQP